MDQLRLWHIEVAKQNINKNELTCIHRHVLPPDMIFEVFGHAEGSNLLCTKDGRHNLNKNTSVIRSNWAKLKTDGKIWL